VAAERTVRPARPHAPSPEELAAHAAFVARLRNPIWEAPALS
jgi:DNA polymerase-3 subunit epsilon